MMGIKVFKKKIKKSELRGSEVSYGHVLGIEIRFKITLRCFVDYLNCQNFNPIEQDEQK